MKRCPRCGKRKPRSTFTPRKRNPNTVYAYCRPCNKERHREYALKPNHDPAPRLPSGPFLKWLRKLGNNPNQIALVAGMNERQVRLYLNDRPSTVSMDVVDRACIHADIRLDDLYPYGEAAA